MNERVCAVCDEHHTLKYMKTLTLTHPDGSFKGSELFSKMQVYNKIVLFHYFVFLTYFPQVRLLPPKEQHDKMESSGSKPPSITQPRNINQPQVPAGLPEQITAYYKLHQPPCGSLQSARVYLDPMLLSPSSKAISPDDPHSILICSGCHRSLSTICLIFLLLKLNHECLTHMDF